MMAFKVGDRAVYPAHGVGVVKRIESRKVGGLPVDFYVLQILSSGASLMIPAANVEQHGMRGLVSDDEIGRIYQILRSPARPANTTWNRRFREFNDKLRSGSILDVAEVLRDLCALRGDKDLSYGEKKMLDKSLSMLAAEISEVTGAPASQVETQLMDMLDSDLV